MEFEVDDAERRHLQEMLKHPGFRVLRKILAAYGDELERDAKLSSRIDPLKNQEEIARKWAYVLLAETLQQRIYSGIEFELGLLTHSTSAARSQETLMDQRRRRILGELDTPQT